MTKDKMRSLKAIIAVILLIFIALMIISANTSAFATGETTPSANSAAVVISDDGTKTYYDTLYGAVEAASSGDTVALLKNVKLPAKDSAAPEQTGAVIIDKKLTLTSVDADNPCTVSGEYKDSLFEIKSEVTMKDIILDGTKVSGDNSASYSSSLVIVSSSGNLTLENGALVTNYELKLDNSVRNEYSGTINLQGGTLNMKSGSKISDCKTTYGGGVFVSNGTLNMYDGSIITSCTARKYGGAVYVIGESSAVNMYGGTMSKNTAQRSGGALCIEAGEFTMHAGLISENTAVEHNGGGVSMGHELTEAGEYLNLPSSSAVHIEYLPYNAQVKLIGGVISNNKAEAGAGGGFNMRTGDVAMSGGEISNNVSKNGGGVCLGASNKIGTFDMTGGTIAQNTAADGGGGVYFNSTDVIFNLKNGASISGNTAVNGGGVSMFVASYFKSDKGVISNNTATSYGGGVHFKTGGSFTIENGSTITENEAKYGGAAYLTSGAFISRDSSITDNHATAGAGAIYVSSGAQLLFEDSEITDNSAVDYASGLYLGPYTSKCILAGDTLFDNKSSGGDIGDNLSIVHLTSGSNTSYVPLTIGKLGESADIATYIELYPNGQDESNLLNLLIGIPRTLAEATDTTEAVYYTITGRDVAKLSVDNPKYMPSLEDDNKVYLKYAIDVALSETEATYDGKAHYPEITVKDYDGEILTEGTDYRVLYYDADGNQVQKSKMIEAGEYDIKIEPVNDDFANVWKVYTIKGVQRPEGGNPDKDEHQDANKDENQNKNENAAQDDTDDIVDADKAEKGDGDGSTESDNAETGDDTNLIGVLMLMVLSQVGMIILLRKMYKIDNY